MKKNIGMLAISICVLLTTGCPRNFQLKSVKVPYVGDLETQTLFGTEKITVGEAPKGAKTDQAVSGSDLEIAKEYLGTIRKHDGNKTNFNRVETCFPVKSNTDFKVVKLRKKSIQAKKINGQEIKIKISAEISDLIKKIPGMKESEMEVIAAIESAVEETTFTNATVQAKAIKLNVPDPDFKKCTTKVSKKEDHVFVTEMLVIEISELVSSGNLKENFNAKIGPELSAKIKSALEANVVLQARWNNSLDLKLNESSIELEKSVVHLGYYRAN